MDFLEHLKSSVIQTTEQQEIQDQLQTISKFLSPTALQLQVELGSLRSDDVRNPQNSQRVSKYNLDLIR